MNFGDTQSGRSQRSAASAAAQRAFAQTRVAAGFTLIELTIAIAVAAVLFAAVITGVGAVTGANAKKAAGELAGTIRAMYDEAALSGRTCRLAFILPDAKAEDGHVTYRAECASGAVATSKNRDEELREVTEEARERAREQQRGGGASSQRAAIDYRTSDEPTLDEILDSEKTRVANAAKFSDYTNPEIPPIDIPKSVRISVWTRQQKAPVTDGIAYLYFYPQGYTERALVFIEQGDNVWTIKVSPLTGKAEVVAEREEIPRT